jgi:hypothetical protein
MKDTGVWRLQSGAIRRVKNYRFPERKCSTNLNVRSKAARQKHYKYISASNAF